MRGRCIAGEGVKLTVTGAEGVLHCFSKHCINVHNVYATLVAEAPRPPTDREKEAVVTMWTIAERRIMMR